MTIHKARKGLVIILSLCDMTNAKVVEKSWSGIRSSFYSCSKYCIAHYGTWSFDGFF